MRAYPKDILSPHVHTTSQVRARVHLTSRRIGAIPLVQLKPQAYYTYSETSSAFMVDYHLSSPDRGVRVSD